MSGDKTVRIGTINLNRIFGALRRTADVQQEMEKLREGLKQELKTREQLLQQMPLTDRHSRSVELTEWRKAQMELLHESAAGHRSEIIDAIKLAVRKIAEVTNLDIVIDTGEVSHTGNPVVLFAKDEFDLTDEIIKVLNGPNSDSKR